MSEWIPLGYRWPPFDEPVEWKRDPRFSKQPNFVKSFAEFNALFNVAGLSWRPLSAKLRELGLTE